MEVVSRNLRMRAIVDDLRRQGRRIAFVPTMGALHEGHLALVRLGRERGAEVVVSIFVNPMQFGAGEDFELYPRDLVRDSELLSKERVAAVFAPSAEEIYPQGHSTRVEVGGLSDILTGEHRAGHFTGVATVVLKLFNIVRPDVAIFGWKDAQQLVLLQKMVRDLNLDIEIVGAPTVRDHDGLASSSRNAYLDDNERRAATAIHRSLQEVMRLVDAGERAPKAIEDAARAILAAQPILEVDYVRAVSARDLSDLKRLSGLVLVLVSVRVKREGRPSVVLIDNVRLDVPDEQLPRR